MRPRPGVRSTCNDLHCLAVLDVVSQKKPTISHPSVLSSQAAILLSECLLCSIERNHDTMIVAIRKDRLRSRMVFAQDSSTDDAVDAIAAYQRICFVARAVFKPQTNEIIAAVQSVHGSQLFAELKDTSGNTLPELSPERSPVNNNLCHLRTNISYMATRVWASSLRTRISTDPTAHTKAKSRAHLQS